MVQVLFTVDTECSLGGAWENPQRTPIDPARSVLGKIGSQYHGTPLIMEILEESGLKGVFFVELFAALNSSVRPSLAEAYSQIAKRGHDVQLHLHPIHYYYHLREAGHLDPATLPADKDMFAAHSLERQSEMLGIGKKLFEELVGRPPIAFRAGNFGVNIDTLEALQNVGMGFDSSFNAAYTPSACKLDSGGAINGSWQHGRVWEVPLTNFRTGGLGFAGLKQLNINAVSLWEMTSVLNQAERTGLRTVSFIAHSFSLFKVADIQFRNLKPDRLVVSRLRGLCRFLKENADRFKVVGFGDLNSTALAGDEKETPRMGMLVPMARKALQAVNRLHWL